MTSPRKAALGLTTASLTAALALTASPAPGLDGPSPQPARAQTPELTLTPLGTVRTGDLDAGASEIVAFDPASERAFVVNSGDGTVDVLSLRKPGKPRREARIEAPGANSVATSGGLVAIAEQAEAKEDRGTVRFVDAATLRGKGSVTVGALPDMVTFTPDGDYALVANEGEPTGYGDGFVDPRGSVSVIDLRKGPRKAKVRTAGFRAFDGREAGLNARGIRVFGPGSTASQDLEPEYVAVSANGRKAMVTLQENNALAVVDVRKARVKKLVPLGLKDHALPRNAMDADDEDGLATLATYPVKGLYLPDAIVAFRSGDEDYYVTANEGDAREYDGLEEESRIEDLTLDPAVFGDATLPPRLNVTTTSPQGPNGYTELWSFGGRSITVRDKKGALVWDSGSALERLVIERDAANHNATNDENPSLDNRSDNKGPEPEGLATGTVKGRTYVFVGLERSSGIAIFDVTRPEKPKVAGYATNRGTGSLESGLAGDLGPEGLTFVAKKDSPTNKPLLLVGNEVSGTTTIWQVG